MGCVSGGSAARARRSRAAALRRLLAAFGPRRLFWGSDLSRLPCPYVDLVEVFRDDLDWLDADTRAEVMGKAVARWHGWAV